MKRKVAAIAALVVYAVLVAVLIWLAARGGVALPAVSRIGLLAQCVITACAAPFFAVSSETFGVKSALRSLLKTCLLIAAGLAGVFFGVLFAGAGIPARWLVASAGLLAGFAAVLAGISTLVASFGGNRNAAQFAGYLLAAAMLGTVFYANPAVANTRGAAKMRVTEAVIIANPMLAMAGAAVDYDIMIGRRSDVSLYYQSLIGPDHLYSYPRWWTASLIYFAAGFIFAAVAGFRHRRSGAE